jgi:hypothetical protein
MTTAGEGNRVKVIDKSPKAGGETTMPLYEYRCRECDQHCELLIRGEEKPIFLPGRSFATVIFAKTL